MDVLTVLVLRTDPREAILLMELYWLRLLHDGKGANFAFGPFKNATLELKKHEIQYIYVIHNLSLQNIYLAKRNAPARP